MAREGSSLTEIRSLDRQTHSQSLLTTLSQQSLNLDSLFEIMFALACILEVKSVCSVVLKKNLKGRDRFEDAGIDRRTLYLQLILKWRGRNLGTGFT